MRKNYGFTLIELMIVVSVIALLGAISYPMYTRYVIKSKRAEAKTALLELSQFQETYRADNNRFSGSLSDLSASENTENGLYKLSIDFDATKPREYTLHAKAVEGKSQTSDEGCTELSLDHRNKKLPADCW